MWCLSPACAPVSHSLFFPPSVSSLTLLSPLPCWGVCLQSCFSLSRLVSLLRETVWVYGRPFLSISSTSPPPCQSLAISLPPLRSCICSSFLPIPTPFSLSPLIFLTCPLVCLSSGRAHSAHQLLCFHLYLALLSLWASFLPSSLLSLSLSLLVSQFLGNVCVPLGPLSPTTSLWFGLSFCLCLPVPLLCPSGAPAQSLDCLSFTSHRCLPPAGPRPFWPLSLSLVFMFLVSSP